jgi:transcriptional regulator with XRE-family HTH domain
MRRLETTVDLLDALMERYGWTSDRQIAAGLKIPQQTISSWRIGRTYPTEVHALTIGKALEIPALMVLAIAAAERTKSDKVAHSEWAKMVKQMAPVMAAWLALGTTPAPMPATAGLNDSRIIGKDVKSRRRLPAAA